MQLCGTGWKLGGAELSLFIITLSGSLLSSIKKSALLSRCDDVAERFHPGIITRFSAVVPHLLSLPSIGQPTSMAWGIASRGELNAWSRPCPGGSHLLIPFPSRAPERGKGLGSLSLQPLVSSGVSSAVPPPFPAQTLHDTNPSCLCEALISQLSCPFCPRASLQSVHFAAALPAFMLCPPLSCSNPNTLHHLPSSHLAKPYSSFLRIEWGGQGKSSVSIFTDNQVKH